MASVPISSAERIALATLRGAFAPGTSADAMKSTVDAAVQAGFAGAPCRGLEYAGERARFVYARVEPKRLLMPGARG